MKIQGIDVDPLVDSIKGHLQNAIIEEHSHANIILSDMRYCLKQCLVVITALTNTITLNSKNSSKPPSTDPNREKKPKEKQSNRKPGAQKGYDGFTLEKVDDPDEIIEIKVDRSTLPEGGHFHEVGIERQVVAIKITKFVTEYRAQILKDEYGKRFVAEFPYGVTRAVQYGSNVRTMTSYMSYYQMIPFRRIAEFFSNHLELSISPGTVFNTNKQTYQLLEPFENWVKEKLIAADVMHADETGINIDSKRHWLHCTSTLLLTLFFSHKKRGKEAMNAMDILLFLEISYVMTIGKPYFKYLCKHVLCNAHHLR